MAAALQPRVTFQRRFATLGRAFIWLLAGVSLATGGTLKAQTVLYWDTNGSAAGSSGSSTAPGTWDQGTTANWTTDSNGTATTRRWNYWSGNKTANFSAGTNATGAYTVTVNGTISNVAGITFAEGTVTLGGSGTLTLAGTPALNVAASSAAISAALAGSVGFSKTGAGTLNLTGANTYTGATNITAGILNLQSAGALGTSSNTANTTVTSGATLQLTNAITTTNAGTLVLNGAGAGSGALQSVSGNNAWNSGISLGSNAEIDSSTAGNTLTLGNSSGTSTFALGSNTVTFGGPGNIFVNSNLGMAGDTGGLVKNGTGMLTLYGYNTYYTGPTTVNAGSLELVVGPFSSGWYGINGPLTIGTGPSNPALAGTVAVDIWTNSYANQISPTSAVTINSDGVLNVGASTGMGSLTLNGGQVNITNGAVVSPTGTITSNANSAHQTSLISGGQLTLGSSTTFNVGRDSTLASDLTVSSVVAGGTLVKQGAGILTLSGANTYTGATTINAGTLQLGAANALPTTTAMTVASGATLNLNNYSATVGSLAGAGVITLGTGTLAVGTNNTSTTFSGTFTAGDTGTFRKTGTGTLTFGAGMNLANGTLVLDGGTLNLGGFTSTFGSLSVTSNSVLDFGTGGASILNLNSLTVSSGAILTVANWTDAVDYFYSLTNPGAASLGRIVFTGFNASDTKWLPFDHQITPVPEPRLYGALLTGLLLAFAGCLRLRDRRRRVPSAR